MIRAYKISGMTCQGCVASVKEKLGNIDEVNAVDIDLGKGEAEINMETHVSLEVLASVLPNKYKISGKENHSEKLQHPSVKEKTKLQQLKPLFLIFAYLFVASFLLNYNDWATNEAMLDFMGLFYIVFSFFKFLDLKGFTDSFRMYDPLAKAVPAYAWVYPFIELILGVLFLMRFQITFALITTIVILGITTLGVIRILRDKKSIQCACLGTALKLPMTEATFIENAIMLLMAISMLAI